jgi:hypothetical protein
MGKYFEKFRWHFDQFIGVEGDQKSPTGLFYLFITALGVAFFILITAVLVKALGFDLGTFGDFIGGTLNPVLTFLTFMGLLITIVLQQTELRESRIELSRSATALESQLDATDRQNFESTFFQMLALHNTIVSSIDLAYSQSGAKQHGRDCFEKFYDNYKDDYEWVGEIEEQQRLQEAYDRFWKERQQDLAHYYRYLYNVLRFVHDYEGIENKSAYVKLLRAQLSDYELVLLFYTALNRHGINYRLYIHEYQLLDNLPKDLLIDSSHAGLYSAQSFGEPKSLVQKKWPPALLAAEHEVEKQAAISAALTEVAKKSGLSHLRDSG